MRRIRQHLTYANVISTLCLFLLLGGGTAVALNGTNTVFTDDVANDTQPASGGNPAGGLTAADLRSGSVGSSEVVNGALNDEDIGQSTYHFTGNLGFVGPQRCVRRDVTGINAQADHLILTPRTADAHPDLDYGVEYQEGSTRAVIRACNPTTSTVTAGTTTFNLLVIDAG